MASESLSDSRRDELRRQVFAGILSALRNLPSYRHTAFVTSILGELIDDENSNLQLLADCIDRAAQKVGVQ